MVLGRTSSAYYSCWRVGVIVLSILPAAATASSIKYTSYYHEQIQQIHQVHVRGTSLSSEQKYLLLPEQHHERRTHFLRHRRARTTTLEQEHQGPNEYLSKKMLLTNTRELERGDDDDSNDNGNNNNNNNNDSRIVGGTETSINEHPYQVAVLVEGNPYCGGSVIWYDMILCAVHCSDMATHIAFKRKYNGLDTSRQQSENNNEQIIKICEKKKHPTYGQVHVKSNDIAMFKLCEPLIDVNPETDFVTLNDNLNLLHVDDTVTVTGWGATTESGRGSDYLNEVQVQVISNDECNSSQMYGTNNSQNPPLIGDDQICAGLSNNGGKDSCQGDSGGPLVVENKNDMNDGKSLFVQVGVVSWGSGCGHADKPGVYANVAHHAKWIQQTADELQSAHTPVKLKWLGESAALSSTNYYSPSLPEKENESTSTTSNSGEEEMYYSTSSTSTYYYDENESNVNTNNGMYYYSSLSNSNNYYDDTNSEGKDNSQSSTTTTFTYYNNYNDMNEYDNNPATTSSEQQDDPYYNYYSSTSSSNQAQPEPFSKVDEASEAAAPAVPEQEQVATGTPLSKSELDDKEEQEDDNNDNDDNDPLQQTEPDPITGEVLYYHTNVGCCWFINEQGEGTCMEDINHPSRHICNEKRSACLNDNVMCGKFTPDPQQIDNKRIYYSPNEPYPLGSLSSSMSTTSTTETTTATAAPNETSSTTTGSTNSSSNTTVPVEESTNLVDEEVIGSNTIDITNTNTTSTETSSSFSGPTQEQGSLPPNTVDVTKPNSNSCCWVTNNLDNIMGCLNQEQEPWCTYDEKSCIERCGGQFIPDILQLTSSTPNDKAGTSMIQLDQKNDDRAGFSVSYINIPESQLNNNAPNITYNIQKGQTLTTITGITYIYDGSSGEHVQNNILYTSKCIENDEFIGHDGHLRQCGNKWILSNVNEIQHRCSTHGSRCPLSCGWCS